MMLSLDSRKAGGEAQHHPRLLEAPTWRLLFLGRLAAATGWRPVKTRCRGDPTILGAIPGVRPDALWHQHHRPTAPPSSLSVAARQPTRLRRASTLRAVHALAGPSGTRCGAPVPLFSTWGGRGELGRPASAPVVGGHTS